MTLRDIVKLHDGLDNVKSMIVLDIGMPNTVDLSLACPMMELDIGMLHDGLDNVKSMTLLDIVMLHHGLDNVKSMTVLDICMPNIMNLTLALA
jgi:hypothetical protein